MVAALRMNRRENPTAETVYGCITIGDQWKFLRLVNEGFTIDRPQYALNQLDRILGILLHMVGFNPPPAPA